MNKAYIIGWGHTPFGKLDKADIESLVRESALPAIESAGIEPTDIDAIFVGHFNAGFVRQDFSGAIAAVAIPEFAWKTRAPQGPRPYGPRWTPLKAAASSAPWLWAWKR